MSDLTPETVTEASRAHIFPAVDIYAFLRSGKKTAYLPTRSQRFVEAEHYDTLKVLCRQLRGVLEGMVSEAVVLSEDYLDAFANHPMDATIQGWDKARWVRALAARKRAVATLALMPQGESGE